MSLNKILREIEVKECRTCIFYEKASHCYQNYCNFYKDPNLNLNPNGGKPSFCELDKLIALRSN
jgi:hypothetical protein